MSLPHLFKYHRRPKIFLAASTLVLYSSLSVRAAFLSTASSTSTSSASANSGCSTSSSGTTSSSSTTNPTNNHCNSVNNNMSALDKTTDQLKDQWAGGVDVWPQVPIQQQQQQQQQQVITPTTSKKDTMSIQTRVKEEEESEYSNSSISKSKWPFIVQHSILYGFGAYNPRGQVVPDDINVKQHELLRKDIQDGLQSYYQDIRKQQQKQQELNPDIVYWDGASIWEDGSSERGFIIAVPTDITSSTTTTIISSTSNESIESWIIQLATKYDQGAIYKFTYDTNTNELWRETVPVLDSNTDAKVQVVMDEREVDLSPFSL